MGCCADQSASNNLKNPIERAIRIIIRDMKLSSLKYESFELEVTKLSRNNFADEDYYVWVENSAVDLGLGNIYKDAQLILVCDFHEMQDPFIDFYAWAFSFLLKPHSSEKCILRLIQLFQFHLNSIHLTPLACFKEFLNRYLKFNLVWITKRLITFFRSEPGENFIYRSNITSNDLLNFHLADLESCFNIKICNQIYLDIVSNLEDILWKNNKLAAEEEGFLNEILITEYDLTQLSIKHPYLWDCCQLREFVCEMSCDAEV